MKQNIFIFFIIFSCSCVWAQQDRILIAEIIKEVDEDSYKGKYHEFTNDILNPIENLMQAANFCEIEDNYILLPNFGTEPFDDGTIPLDEMPLSKLYHLLTLDVLNFYEGFNTLYNTPLKQKRFKESSEYKEFVRNLKSEKKHLLSDSFYSIHEISEDETFDLNSHTFEFYLPYGLTGYDLFLSSQDPYFRNNYFITPKMDEDTAYQIETNDCEIVVFVKFTGDTRIHGVSKQSIIVPTDVYIVDKNTGEIYYNYTPSNRVESDNAEEFSPNENSSEKEIIETNANFPGGEVALMKFLNDNLKYPKEAKNNNLTGRVIVSFTISKNGMVEEVRIQKGVAPVLDEEAIRVIKLMPRWIPATFNGHPVSSHLSLPITFK